MSETREIMESLGVAIKPTYTAIQEIEDNGVTIAEVALADEVARLRAENAALREALGNAEKLITEFLPFDGNPEHACEYHAIAFVLQQIRDALSPQDVPAHANPPDTPSGRATAHESAGDGGIS